MTIRTLPLLGFFLCVGGLGCSSDGDGGNGSSTTGPDGGGGTSSAGGAGNGSGGASAPFVTNGDPITAPSLTWTWIDFPDTSCRDGSTSGLAVNFNDASDKVMIYLEGGGACFDPSTCAVNPSNTTGMQGGQTQGLFDRNNAENPVKDWNFVYVPYCTGDIHGGTNESGAVAGLPPQKFVGRKNMESYLNRIVPTFPSPGQVLLTGISAGGFGAAVNADLVARAFGDVPMTLLDDSGPSMSAQYLPECLQEQWRTLWGFDGSILADCGSACPNPNDYAIDFSKFLAGKYPDRESGVIDAVNDSVITLFYGFGQNDCTGSLATPVPGDQFNAGLLDFREQMKDYPNFYTYFPAGSQHTWISGPSVYTEAEGGVRLIDWITAIINNEPTTNVGN